MYYNTINSYQYDPSKTELPTTLIAQRDAIVRDFVPCV